MTSDVKRHDVNGGGNDWGGGGGGGGWRWKGGGGRRQKRPGDLSEWFPVPFLLQKRTVPDTNSQTLI